MLHRVVFVETVVAHGITGKFHVRQLLEPGAEVSALARSLSSSHQGTINCGILVAGVGGSGDPRRKWESERESVAFVCKMI